MLINSFIHFKNTYRPDVVETASLQSLDPCPPDVHQQMEETDIELLREGTLMLTEPLQCTRKHFPHQLSLSLESAEI